MKKPKRWCWYCKHRGPRFRVPVSGNDGHIHCGHHDHVVANRGDLPPEDRGGWATLRRAFEAPTKLRIPIDRETREDLHAMRQVVGGGQYNYWAPRTREGHSDRCTALALAVRAAGDGAVQQGIL
jgi:hypothetical protein